MTPSDEYNIRRQQLENHISLLEERYSQAVRAEAIKALEERLRSLELENRQ